MRDIRDVLNRLGIHNGYSGRSMIISAVDMARKDRSVLFNLSKMVYAPIAEQCKLQPITIHRNVMICAEKAYKTNRTLLKEIVGCDLTKQPTAKMFLMALADYVNG